MKLCENDITTFPPWRQAMPSHKQLKMPLPSRRPPLKLHSWPSTWSIWGWFHRTVRGFIQWVDKKGKIFTGKHRFSHERCDFLVICPLNQPIDSWLMLWLMIWLMLWWMIWWLLLFQPQFTWIPWYWGQGDFVIFLDGDSMGLLMLIPTGGKWGWWEQPQPWRTWKRKDTYHIPQAKWWFGDSVGAWHDRRKKRDIAYNITLLISNQ